MSDTAIASALRIARKYANGGAVNTNPSMAQREAGNYKMRHITFQGLPITIENPKGTIRKGIDHTGKKWATRMTEDYGYIKRTEGHDGDHVDCFVGPDKKSDRVFVIDQIHNYGKDRFDEHKCMLGFNSKKKAFKAYKKSYGPSYGSRHEAAAMTEMSVDAFKEWLKGGGGKKPLAPDVPKMASGGKVKSGDTSMEDKLYSLETEELADRIRNREYPPEALYAAKGIDVKRDLMIEPPEYYMTYSPANPNYRLPGNPPWTFQSFQEGGVVGGKKITRDAFLYMNPKPPKDTFAQCGTCVMFTGTGCTIMGKTKITKEMTCALYVHGKPSFNLKGKELALVTPQEAGLYDGKVRCENCRYGGEHCELFKALNKKMPGMFDLETKIDSKGCCNAFTNGPGKYQEGGAVDEVSDEDLSSAQIAQQAAPREGGLMQTIPQFAEMVQTPEGRSKLWEATKTAASGFIPGMVEQVKGPGEAMAGKMTPEQEVEWATGTGLGMIGGRSPFAEPGTLGIAGGKPPGKPGPEAVHYWSQTIADRLTETHGSDLDAIQSSLDKIRQVASERASTAVFAKLPEDVQFDLAMRDMHPQLRESAEASAPPPFREITHPEEAKDWLREHGHSPEDMGFSDPESYVIEANRLKKEEEGFSPPAEEPPPLSREIRSAAAADTLDKFFNLASPSEVPHLPPGDLMKIRDLLSKVPNPYDYEAANPDLWNAVHKRFDELDSIYRERATWKTEPETAQQREDPGPFASMKSTGYGGSFRQMYDTSILPHAGSPEDFAKYYFGGVRTDKIAAHSTVDEYGHQGMDFDGNLFTNDGRYIGRIHRTIFPEAKYANHHWLELATPFRGGEVAPGMLRNQIDLYKKMGLNWVQLTAGLDGGGHAWARYGFLPTHESWNVVRSQYQKMIDTGRVKIENPGRTDIQNQKIKNRVMSILSDSDPHAIWELSDIEAPDANGRPIGNAILAGTYNWHGTLNLNDPISMMRFDAYVEYKRKKAAEKKRPAGSD